MSVDPLSGLAKTERAQLEKLLVDFDQHWSADRLTEVVGQLSASGPVRIVTVRELVKIDLERQWQAGKPVTLQQYQSRFPELFDTGTVPADLVQAEADARQAATELAERPSVHLPKPGIP